MLPHHCITRCPPDPETASTSNLQVVCGRFSITGDLDFYAEYFGVDEVRAGPIEPSWNVAPTDEVLVVAERDHVRSLGSMKWGLVPHWAKDERSIQINARVETVGTAPMFRDSVARRRCLIPADGFYEWEPPDRGRTPHWIYRADGHPMVFAGIWAARHDPKSDSWNRSCSIITTEAVGFVANIHDRMPVTLDRSVWDTWLDRDMTDSQAAVSLISGTDPEEWMEYVVSRRVNSVKNNSPHLREPVEPETLF